MRKLLTILLIIFLLSEAVNISFAYTMERPPRTIDSIGQRDENATVDDEAAVGIGVDIHEYRENAAGAPYTGKDGVLFRVIATANTRKGIDYDYYTCQTFTQWVEATTPTNITGDNSGAWLNIPFGVAFYGGPGVQNASAMYSRIWVCSNGFVSFDCDSTSPTPCDIPAIALPNTIIAPYWSDIDPIGGSITYYASLNKFVVEWKNVKSKYNNERQTFEIVILNDYYPHYRGQNRFFLLYETVTWPDPPAIDVVVGIEDQEGYKGIELPFTESGLGYQLTTRPFGSPEIRELSLSMSKTDSNAKVYIDRNPYSLRGANVQYDEQSQLETPVLDQAVCGFVTLLMSAAIGHYYGVAAGLMFGFTRITLEQSYAYAKQLWKAHPYAIRDENDAPGADFCYFNVSAATIHPPYDYPVDASVGAQVFWVFLDDNNLDHELTLTAQLKYYSQIQGKIVALNTSTTLRVYIGTPLTPAKPGGPASGYIGLSCNYSTSTTTPDGDSIYYKFDWKDGSTTTIGPYPSGTMVSCSHTWGSAGTYDVQVRAKDSSYGVWSAWSSSLTVTITSGGGGCPYVYTWDGQQYVMDNNLLPASEMSNGADVEDHYMLEQPLVPSHQGTAFSLYSLQIREFEHEHDFIDQVKLLAVDHKSDVDIAVTPDGEILTYSNPAPPISAVDKDGIDVLSQLSSVDGNYYQGYNGSHITVTFTSTDVSNGIKLVIRDDLPPVFEKCPVYVQVLNATRQWNTVAVFYSRTYWATDIINMTDYLPDANGDLKVRLCFVSNDKIDYVGLDTTPQASIKVHQALLLSAFHSTQGNIKPLLMKNDQTYAELTPGQQIQLTFQLPNNRNDERTFILYTEGHYHKIET